jgi:hypothetical protein
VKFISLVAEVLNLTLNYRICGESCRVGEYRYTINVIADFRHMNLYSIKSYDTTISYLFDTLIWFVPCPKSALKFDKILSLFNYSVWFTMLLVIFCLLLCFRVQLNCSLELSLMSHTVIELYLIV